jgi:hypothetical protein
MISYPPTRPGELRTTLFDCSSLGLAAFDEAEDKLAKINLNLRAITEWNGIV